MPWGILLYESFGKYWSFTMADDTLYDMMRQTLSTEEGRRKYGMTHIGGKKGIRDTDIDRFGRHVRTLVERLNQGESLDLENELDALP